MRAKSVLAFAAGMALLTLMAAAPAWAMPPAMLEQLQRFDAWAIDGDLTTSQRERLATLFEEEWQRAPASMSDRVRQIARLSPRLHPGQFTPADGELRERLWERANNAVDPYLGREVAILADNPAVVGTDRNRIATQASVFAFAAAQNLIRKLAGLPLIADSEGPALLQEARQTWPSLPPVGRERLLTATIQLQRLKNMLADTTMRAGVLRDIHNHVHGVDDAAAMTVAQEDVALRFQSRMANLGAQANRQAAMMTYMTVVQHAFLRSR